MSKHITHWIGGKPWAGESERHGDVYDPATGQVTGQVAFASPAEVDLAVAAALGLTGPGLAADPVGDVLGCCRHGLLTPPLRR